MLSDIAVTLYNIHRMFFQHLATFQAHTYVHVYLWYLVCMEASYAVMCKATPIKCSVSGQVAAQRVMRACGLLSLLLC